MKRLIDSYLANWKNDKYRKVLIIRGARQVGKTYSVREFSRQFKHFLEINFEEEKEIKTFFQGSLDPVKIIEKLSAYYSIPIIPGETLLFFDEIQASNDALRSLRFFYEKIPDLHVVAAGSLLEFVLLKISSYGVGRISTLYMYPMCFSEFLIAMNEPGLIKTLNTVDFKNPLEKVFF
jgi:predicted AAA+ superfamily ATPase